MNTVQQDLTRFKEAQKLAYQQAYNEMEAGKKWTHWMWFIFPQMRGLGHSKIAFRYGITSMEEATAYLNDPVLGPRLVDICKVLQQHTNKSAHSIFGTPDDMKFRSCLTLFSKVPSADPVFAELLQQFYGGHACELTTKLLSQQ